MSVEWGCVCVAGSGDEGCFGSTVLDVQCGGCS